MGTPEGLLAKHEHASFTRQPFAKAAAGRQFVVSFSNDAVVSSNRVSERKHTSNVVFKDICAKAVAKACVGSPKGPNRFILDSGASFHIISRTDLTEDQIKSIYKMDAAIEIETVNGTVSTTEVVDLVLLGLWDHEITAIVVDGSPPLISLGRLCFLNGFSFKWPKSRCPKLFTPDGFPIPLEIDEFVPHVHHRGADHAYCGAVATAMDTELSESLAEADDCSEDVHRFSSTVDVKMHPSSTSSSSSSKDLVPMSTKGEADVSLEAEADDELRCRPCDGTSTPERETRLRKEAVSLKHLLTHLPKNPYCQACLRAKLNKAPARRVRGEGAERPASFSAAVTSDHLISKDDASLGFDGDATVKCSTILLPNLQIFIHSVTERLLKPKRLCATSLGQRIL